MRERGRYSMINIGESCTRGLSMFELEPTPRNLHARELRTNP